MFLRNFLKINIDMLLMEFCCIELTILPGCFSSTKWNSSKTVLLYVYNVLYIILETEDLPTLFEISKSP